MSMVPLSFTTTDVSPEKQILKGGVVAVDGASEDDLIVGTLVGANVTGAGVEIEVEGVISYVAAIPTSRCDAM
jgi:hypothetical protein